MHGRRGFEKIRIRSHACEQLKNEKNKGKVKALIYMNFEVKIFH